MRKSHPIIAALLIVAILGMELSFLAIKPKKVEAFSFSSVVMNFTFGDVPREATEKIINVILKKTVQIISAIFLRSLTAWVRSGFNGQPQFVKDPERFLKGLLQNGQINHQLQLLATELCYPLGGGRGGGVTVKSPNISGYPRLKCTINHPNLKNFFNNFNDGGWETFNQLLQPQNNIFGMLAIGSDLRNQELGKQAAAGTTEQIASQGFLGIKQCAVAMSFATLIDGKNYTSQNCAKYHNVTPGSVVATKIQKGLSMDEESWVNAHAFSDLIAALLDSVVNKLIGTKFMCLSCAGTAAPATATVTTGGTGGGLNWLCSRFNACTSNQVQNAQQTCEGVCGVACQNTACTPSTQDNVACDSGGSTGSVDGCWLASNVAQCNAACAPKTCFPVRCTPTN